MNYPPTRDLPASLLTALYRLDAAAWRTGPRPDDVAAVVSELDRLTPSRVNDAYAVISSALCATWTPAPSGWRLLPEKWNLLAPSRPNRLNHPRLIQLMDQTPGLQTLFLFHPDGHLREAALKRLTTASSAFILTAVALRLNDWALPVRRAARACAMRVFATAPAIAVAEAALLLLERKTHWRRGGEELKYLDEAFSRPDIVDGLYDLIVAGQTGLVARALNHALTTDLMDDRLLDIADAAVSPAIRVMALRTLIDGQTRRYVGHESVWTDKTFNESRRVPRYERRPVRQPVSAGELIARCASDRSAVVRRMAADALVRHRRELPDATALVSLFIADPSPSVRQRAAFVASELAKTQIG